MATLSLHRDALFLGEIKIVFALRGEFFDSSIHCGHLYLFYKVRKISSVSLKRILPPLRKVLSLPESCWSANCKLLRSTFRCS